MNMESRINYQDFRVQLLRSGDGYKVKAISPSGRVAQHHCSSKLLGDISSIVEKWHEDINPVIVRGWAEMAREMTRVRGINVPTEIKGALANLERDCKEWQSPRGLGQKLREFLLPCTSETWKLFCQVLRETEEKGERLRLRLIIEAQELMGIPWEYLYVKEFDFSPMQAEARSGINWSFHRTSGFLAADGSISLIRQVSLHEPPRVRAKQLRVLVVISNPQKDPQYQVAWPPLNAADELQRLRAALQDLEARNVISLDFLEPNGTKASKENLQRKLQEERFHIIHYIGHAFYYCPSPDERFISALRPGAWLVLEGEDGEAEYLSIEELASWLKHNSVRLVVLNACETARQLIGHQRPPFGAAQALLQRLPVVAVVAMQFRMPDDSAPHFTEVLYRSLASQMPVDACVGAGRALLSGRVSIYRPDWGIPAVFASSGDLHIYEPGDEVLDAIAPQLTELPGSLAGNTFQNKGHVENKLVELDVEGERRKVLELRFYLHSDGAYGGWMIQLEGPRFDATPYSWVRFKLAGAQGGERVEIKFKSHRTEYVEALGKEIDLEEEEAYTPQGLPGPGIVIEKTVQKGWQDIVVPLNSVNIDWSRLRVITVATNDAMLRSFLGRGLPGEERVYIAEVHFEGEQAQR